MSATFPPADTEAFLARSRAATRRFRLTFRLLLAALFGSWIASVILAHRWEEGDWRRAAVALSPVIPLAALIWFFRRFAARVDEFGRRIIIEGAAWGMAVSLPVVFLCGLIRNTGLVPHLDWLTIALVIMWTACGTGLIRAGRRMR